MISPPASASTRRRPARSAKAGSIQRDSRAAWSADVKLTPANDAVAVGVLQPECLESEHGRRLSKFSASADWWCKLPFRGFNCHPQGSMLRVTTRAFGVCDPGV